MNKNIVFIVALTALTLSYQNCSRAKYDRFAKGDISILRGPGEPACIDDSFTQPTKQIGKVDILFVTDTSSSLNEERANVADGISSFVQELPSDVDYNIAVLLAHAERSATSGKLWSNGSSQIVLPKSLGLENIRSLLRNRLVNVVEEDATDGGEAGLVSLNKLLSPGYLETAKLQGFFREDAGLAVVFVSDENDICYKGSVIDPQNKEIPAYNKFCKDLNADTVLASLRSAKQEKPITVSGVLYVDKSRVASGSENEIGRGYLDIIAKHADGHAADMFIPSQIANGLAEIGIKTRIALNLRTTIDIILSQLDLSTVYVNVDGSPARFDVSLDQTKIILPEPGNAGSSVEYGYCGTTHTF